MHFFRQEIHQAFHMHTPITKHRTFLLYTKFYTYVGIQINKHTISIQNIFFVLNDMSLMENFLYTNKQINFFLFL